MEYREYFDIFNFIFIFIEVVLLKSKFPAPAICFPIGIAQELPLGMTQFVVVALVVFPAFPSRLLPSLFILFIYTLLRCKLSTGSAM